MAASDYRQYPTLLLRLVGCPQMDCGTAVSGYWRLITVTHPDPLGQETTQMRKWHRWTTIFFGLFMLWMAVTGLASHVTALWPEPPVAGYSPVPAGFVCPETMSCRPKPPPGSMKTLVGFFHHLHSGEQFGPIGTALSIMTGIALLFFSVSGIWMYVSMWRHRVDRKLNPRWFWR